MLNRTVRFLPIIGVVGCYSYRPLDPATVPVGTEVRAHITGAASDRVAPLIGSLDTRILIGNVIENNGGALTLDVPRGAMPNVPDNVIPLHARLPIVASDLVTLEQRKLDVGRTLLLSASVGAGVALGVSLALRSGSNSEGGKDPSEPPPIIRIPVWRLHF